MIIIMNYLPPLRNKKTTQMIRMPFNAKSSQCPVEKPLPVTLQQNEEWKESQG